jgi:hypothetical protein
VQTAPPVAVPQTLTAAEVDVIEQRVLAAMRNEIDARVAARVRALTAPTAPVAVRARATTREEADVDRKLEELRAAQETLSMSMHNGLVRMANDQDALRTNQHNLAVLVGYTPTR